MLRFHENQTVVLTQNYRTVGLQEGDEGTIWALYQTTPLSYEVRFLLPDKTEVDLTLAENEIALPHKKGESK